MSSCGIQKDYYFHQIVKLGLYFQREDIGSIVSIFYSFPKKESV